MADLPVGRFHTGDPSTSIEAAFNLKYRIEWEAERHRLLREFGWCADYLSDEKAGVLAKVDGYNEKRRCSDLRKDGLIKRVEGVFDTTRTGATCMVCRITRKGIRVLNQLENDQLIEG